MKFKILIFTLLCSLGFMTSCEAPIEEEKQANQVSELSGEEIFKAAFFSLGEAANNIPSFSENVAFLNDVSKENPEFLDNYITNVNSYVDQIDKLNPDYFNQLQEAVYSKDFVEIKKAMELGTLLILPSVVLNNMEDIESSPMKKELMALNIESVDFQNEEALLTLSQNVTNVLAKYKAEYHDVDEKIFAFAAVVAVAVAAVGNLAYAVNVAYQGNVAWNVNWVFEANPGDGTQDFDNYKGEQLIQEIAFGFNK